LLDIVPPNAEVVSFKTPSTYILATPEELIVPTTCSQVPAAAYPVPESALTAPFDVL
jgi:hypothetical protein